MKQAVLFLCAGSLWGQVVVPRTWDEAALKDWATPIAKLGVRPGHFSAEEYYGSPVDNYRTYPVYAAGREPAGYWDRLQKAKPEPLVVPENLKNSAEWVAAGKRVFRELDLGSFRQYDRKVIDQFHNGTFKGLTRIKPAPDGTIPGARWVVTDRGLALSASNCTGCHQRLLDDGSLLDGPGISDTRAFFVTGLLAQAPGMSTIALPGDSDAMGNWRSFAVPWIEDDAHATLRTIKGPAFSKIFLAAVGPNLVPRWNGSILYPTKIPDLIALKGQKYIDHTGTHKLRGTADLMRYSALVSYSDSSDFGAHRMLTDAQRKVPFHLTDETLFALALYVESLEAPVNPNRFDAQAAAGQKVFDENCKTCHAPPFYTSGKLTLATGFQPSKDILAEYDVLPFSVGTDSALALKTRKGTGFYKVPSLRGVWYRGRFLHDGAVTSLEEMFDLKRLKPEFVPTGFKGTDKTRAVLGHEFGLRLPAQDKAALLVFLRTL